MRLVVLAMALGYYADRLAHRLWLDRTARRQLAELLADLTTVLATGKGPQT